MTNSLEEAHIVVEYKGECPRSLLFPNEDDYTLLDDLLMFMTPCSGTICQYVWKEQNPISTDATIKTGRSIRRGDYGGDEWALGRNKSFALFEGISTRIPSIPSEQPSRALSWFVSAQREFELGRPLVETALNWVCLECQGNLLYPKLKGMKQVQELLSRQGFPLVPKLGHFYGLRNNAFHQGKLVKLSEDDAQATRTAGRSLARAQILNLLGVDHTEFRKEFVQKYAN
ncbi:MAG: hypothetical protein FJ319_01645 [SAR202 cluster bacterium]|nr:hypothetical protein [SAR202 cluster bacterium]